MHPKVQGSSELLKNPPPKHPDPDIKTAAENYMAEAKLTTDDD